MDSACVLQLHQRHLPSHPGCPPCSEAHELLDLKLSGVEAFRLAILTHPKHFNNNNNNHHHHHHLQPSSPTSSPTLPSHCHLGTILTPSQQHLNAMSIPCPRLPAPFPWALRFSVARALRIWELRRSCSTEASKPMDSTSAWADGPTPNTKMYQTYLKK